MVDLTAFYERYPEWVTESSNDASSEFRVHLFGPYRGEFHSILESIAQYLRDNGYEGSHLCSELPDHGRPEEMSQEEKWWWESVYCMEEADAAIFLFFEGDAERLDDEPKQGLNSSVIAELVFWTHFFTNTGEETLVVFEEGMMDNMGSLIPGAIDAHQIEDYKVDNNDIEAMREMALTNCMDWMCH